MIHRGRTSIISQSSTIQSMVHHQAARVRRLVSLEVGSTRMEIIWLLHPSLGFSSFLAYMWDNKLLGHHHTQETDYFSNARWTGFRDYYYRVAPPVPPARPSIPGYWAGSYLPRWHPIDSHPASSGTAGAGRTWGGRRRGRIP